MSDKSEEGPGRIAGRIGAEIYICEGCGKEINPVTDDYLREDGVPHPRRFHYGDESADECASPRGLIATRFSADDPRSFHAELRGH